MKKTLRTKFSVLLVLLLTFATILSVSAAKEIPPGTREPQKIGKSTIHIHDWADLLTDAQEEDLVGALTRSCEKLPYNILFLTTKDTNGKDIETYSEDYMDALFPNTDNCVGFVIDIKNRNFYVNTMGEAINKISDKDIELAVAEGAPSLKNEEYSRGFTKTALYTLNRLSAPTKSQGSFLTEFVMGLLQYAIAAVLVAALVFIVLIARHRKANAPYAAEAYASRDDYDIVNREMNYLRSYQTVQRGFYSSDSDKTSSGSGGGSSHTSSSGRSHGGGGCSF